MAVTVLTFKKLFALSGNVFVFSRCGAPIYDTEEDVITGEICHIRGKSRNGPRYDPHQTEGERNGYENLVLMCSPHNKIVDDPTTRHKYTAEILTGYKQKHEAHYKNSVVQPALLQRFVSKFRDLLPPVPRAPMLRIAVSFLRRIPHIAEDEYGLRIRCSNPTDKTIDNLQLELQVPSGYRLALFEIPQKVEGRSAIQTQTCVLLQVRALQAGEHVGLRVFFSVPIERYPLAFHDRLELLAPSGDHQLEIKEFSLDFLLAGLRAPLGT